MTDTSATFITVDREAFREDCEKLLHGSQFWADIQGGLVLDLHHPETALASFGTLVQHVIASVEVVKANALAMENPSGTPQSFSSVIAFEVAADILHDTIKFGGAWGHLINMLDSPAVVAFCKFAVETGIAAYRSKDWLAIAKGILGIVATVGA
jgi:hypothetical protein